MARARVKRFYIPLGFKRNLAVSLRKFRTQPQYRSERHKQFVHAINGGKYRELAIRLEPKSRRQKKPDQAKRLRLAYSPKLAPLALMIAGFTGLVYSGLNLRNPVTLNLVGSNLASAASVRQTPAPPVAKSLPESKPLSISIPKIQVNTSLVPVGLQPNGAVALPPGFDIAGWYDKSPTPGELGPSIIVGHVDSYKGIAVFWRLRELLPGDKIIISRADGSEAAFRVTSLRQFSQKSFPTQEVYGNIDYAGIRLITCSGTFSETSQHYDHNMVVYGKLE